MYCVQYSMRIALLVADLDRQGGSDESRAAPGSAGSVAPPRRGRGDRGDELGEGRRAGRSGYSPQCAHLATAAGRVFQGGRRGQSESVTINRE